MDHLCTINAIQFHSPATRRSTCENMLYISPHDIQNADISYRQINQSGDEHFDKSVFILRILGSKISLWWCLKTDFRCNRSNTYIFIQWFPIHATSTVSSNKSREMHLSRLLKPQIYDRYFVLSTFPFYFITLWTDLNIRKLRKLRFSKVHGKQMIQSTAIFQRKILRTILRD